jgi:[histone H3]-trimethyl-L-lysine4 demethylase
MTDSASPAVRPITLAAIFRPSAEEWQDPLGYIATVVRPEAETQGVAKIIPPEGWVPPFSIDKQSFKFPTRVQAVHQLQSPDHGVAAKQWWDEYTSFLRSIGSRHKKNPTYLAQEIDLYRLHKLVSKKGGYQTVTDEKGWRDIANILEVRARFCVLGV